MNKFWNCVLFISSLIISPNLSAQAPLVENAVFWEITGNNVPEPSYLFGTFHVLGSKHLDTLNNVQAKFSLSQTFASEVSFDSTMIPKLVEASAMTDTTLDMLLSKDLYENGSEWLQELSPYTLEQLNHINPVSVKMLITNLLQMQMFGDTGVPMDVHLEREAVSAGKRIVGLETFDDQLAVLFSFSNQRQSELLIEFVETRSSAEKDLANLNQLYREQKISALAEISLTAYTPEELELMLDNRNTKWLMRLPQLLHEGSTFIAVGALHLTGRNGLVNRLRMLGYSVTPLPIQY